MLTENQNDGLCEIFEDLSSPKAEYGRYFVLALCEKNTQFYEHCPPFVTAESIRDDMKALPQRKANEPQDKYYLGYFDKTGQLIAVIDFIDHYPTAQSCFIGFFMVERSMQGAGIGSAIITELCEYLYCLSYEYVRLGYVAGNKQSEAFWKKNQFTDTGLRNHAQDYTVVVMNRGLNIKQTKTQK